MAWAFLAAAANGITMVAFPWLVLQRTGRAVDASIVAGAATLPLLVATLIAGTAVDFVGRRRVAMLADALSAVSVAAIPVLALTLVGFAVLLRTALGERHVRIDDAIQQFNFEHALALVQEER